MLNKKGQSLVLFIILIPIIIMLVCFVVDISFVASEDNKLDNLNKYIIKRAFSNTNELEEEILENDNDIVIKKIKITDDKINVSLTKKVKSIFGGIIGIKEYNLNSSFEGNRSNNKIYKN